MARGVNHVERVIHAIHSPRHAHGLTLDRDSSFALDVHAIEILGPHVAVANNPSDSEHAVGERGFSVIDVRDDAEISDYRRVRA
jgi:hypothetical protein